MAFSSSIKSLLSTNPSKDIEEELSADYPKSSKQLSFHAQILDMFNLTSRALYICGVRTEAFQHL